MLPDDFMPIALQVCAVLAAGLTVVTISTGGYRTSNGLRTLFLTVPFLAFYLYLMFK